MKEKLVKGSFTKKNIIVFLASFLFMFIIFSFIPTSSDDFTYTEYYNNQSFFAFIKNFYLTWSGRVTSNTLAFFLSNINRLLIKSVLNSIVFILLAYRVVYMIDGNVSIERYTLSFFGLLCISSAALGQAFFWMTGSFYYLWPITGAVFLITPFISLITHNKNNLSKKNVSFYCFIALLFTMCNEQLSLCILGFMCVFMLYNLIYIKKKISLFYIIVFVFAVIGSIILFLAPGNKVRYLAETITHFPGFNLLSVKEHFKLGLSWMYEQLFVTLFNLLYALMIGLYISIDKSKIKKSFLLLLKAIIVIPLISLIYNNQFTQILFDFKLESLGNIFHVLKYIYWTVFIISLFYLSCKKHILFFISIVASFCSLLVMCFSPTIYASGVRTTMVSAIILFLLIFYLFRKEKSLPIILLVFLSSMINISNLVLKLYDKTNL